MDFKNEISRIKNTIPKNSTFNDILNITETNAEVPEIYSIREFVDFCYRLDCLISKAIGFSSLKTKEVIEIYILKISMELYIDNCPYRNFVSNFTELLEKLLSIETGQYEIIIR